MLAKFDSARRERERERERERGGERGGGVGKVTQNRVERKSAAAAESFDGVLIQGFLTTALISVGR
jgi:hypothetical protein